jgi:hypothetical protein
MLWPDGQRPAAARAARARGPFHSIPSLRQDRGKVRIRAGAFKENAPGGADHAL